jgi:hypothetical protein
VHCCLVGYMVTCYHLLRFVLVVKVLAVPCTLCIGNAEHVASSTDASTAVLRESIHAFAFELPTNKILYFRKQVFASNRKPVTICRGL